MRESGLFKILDRTLGVALVSAAGFWRRLFGVYVTGRPPLGRGDKVLVIKLSALGDTLLLLPLLKAIRARVGAQGRLEVVCTGVNRQALEGLAWIDTLHVLSPAAALARPWTLLALLGRLRRGRFDVCLDFDQWLRATALLSLFAGVRMRVGFRTRGQHRHALYHATAENRGGEHEFEQFKRLAAKAGVPPRGVEGYSGFVRRHRLYGADAKAKAPRRVVLHPGCGGKGWQREWPVESYGELAGRLAEQGYEVLATAYGGREAALAGRVAALSGGQARVLRLEGGLAQLARVLQGARLLVCGNTGLMHLAAGLGVKVLALHGPTDPVKWGPLAEPGKAEVVRAGLGCSPCLALGFEYGCEERPCMEAMSVDLVERRAKGMLAA